MKTRGIYTVSRLLPKRSRILIREIGEENSPKTQALYRIGDLGLSVITTPFDRLWARWETAEVIFHSEDPNDYNVNHNKEVRNFVTDSELREFLWEWFRHPENTQGRTRNNETHVIR